MKTLIIRDFGPITNAEIELKKVNLIIGPQSSGKSCILKVASYCTWVEKQIESKLSAERFYDKDYFMEELVRFHKLDGYPKETSFISYESDHIYFSYDKEGFNFQWKKGRWNFLRSQITYIPAERNLVAAIPNWLDVKFKDDNIRSFMAEWERARKAYNQEKEILNLGISYKYDKNTQSDKVKVSSKVTLDFTNTSSGLQSLIPLFIHLDYIQHIQHLNDKEESIAQSNANKLLKEQMSAMLGDKYETTYRNFIETRRSCIFVEEPENNLFPPTQSRLTDWLLDINAEQENSTLFIATHSPYVLTTILEKDLAEFTLLLVKNNDELSEIKCASHDDIREIYECGIDAFYNIESYT